MYARGIRTTHECANNRQELHDGTLSRPEDQ